jgi:hypothetical protein
MLKNGRVYPGNPMLLTLSIVDDDGNYVDPATIQIRLMSPCGRELTYVYLTDDEVIRVSAGQYTADVTPDESGRWSARWETTNPVLVQEDSFIVLTSPFVTDCYRDYV